jgi:hypothetical protein
MLFNILPFVKLIVTGSVETNMSDRQVEKWKALTDIILCLPSLRIEHLCVAVKHQTCILPAYRLSLMKFIVFLSVSRIILGCFHK